MKGILFKPSMIKAIMDGRKTMTRRTSGIGLIDPMATEIVQSDQWGKGDFIAHFPYKDCDPVRYEVTNILKPKYKVGETIYVKEGYAISDAGIFCYKLDGGTHDFVDGIGTFPLKWHNSMFMPASAARTFLKITNVRVEKLGDITVDDIAKEGVGLSYQEWVTMHPIQVGSESGRTLWGLMQEGAWKELWRSINGSYDPDTWVFVYEFTVVPKPENL